MWSGLQAHHDTESVSWLPGCALLRVTPGDARPLLTGASSAGGAGAEWVSPLSKVRSSDVPSHALPPLTAILPLYLDALLKASEPASST